MIFRQMKEKKYITEEEFKTRFDLTCFGILLTLCAIGALSAKGCQYGMKKLDQHRCQANISHQKALILEKKLDSFYAARD